MAEAAPSTPIEVLLVDDHPLVRDGITALLTGLDHIHVCACATCAAEALEMAARLEPDVIVMDIGLPDLNGLEATRQLMETAPGTRVIVLTVYDNKEYILRAARLGARGYLVKNSPSMALREAIETVHAGRLCFPQELMDLVVRELGSRSADPPTVGGPPTLSTRERQVLGLIAEGLSNRDIGERLSLSVRTIETHRQHLMDKLDIHSVAGLTKYTIAAGLTPLE
jgi:two-component system nitrate/nitrite response regulator NarL